MIQDFHPGSGLFTHLRGQKGTGSRIRNADLTNESLRKGRPAEQLGLPLVGFTPHTVHHGIFVASVTCAIYSSLINCSRR